MSPYLEFEVGNMNEVRGRALLCLVQEREDQHTKQVGLIKLVDINGTKLKEDILAEIIEGRLIAIDIFEPFYTKDVYLKEKMSYKEVLDFCEREKRDLVIEQIAPFEEGILSEATIERMLAKYTTIYRENLYLRIVQGFADEIFRFGRRLKKQNYYVGVFQLAYWMCLLGRARRDENIADVDYFKAHIQNVSASIPILNIKRILCSLILGNGKDWQDIADYLDAFYLTLKRHYPIPLKNSEFLRVNKGNVDWLNEGVANQYEEYFLALMNENYEKAMILKETFENRYSSEYLSDCCETN